MSTALAATAPLDPRSLQNDFPILKQKVHGKPLVYLDNAATSQTPTPVVQAVEAFYREDCSNIHRGVHTLSERATKKYEAARDRVKNFIGAQRPEEIIFTRGTTESINLVAYTYGQQFIGPGDEIIISTLEHHSNIVPWQQLCKQKNAVLKIIPIDDRGQIVFERYVELLSPRTKLVAITQVSNALGTITPIKAVVEHAHKRGAVVLVDGAQAVPHDVVDVQDLGCDFFAFSGHKMYGPMGIGVLYGKKERLDAMPPFQGGGDMIRSVTFEETTFNELPYKFEAGTPNVSGAIGLGAAVDYLESIGMPAIADYQHQLLEFATDQLQQVPGLHLIGTAREKAAVCSFSLAGIHPHDIGTILDQEGVAIRTGHHCAQPLMDRLGVAATARASFAFYNTPEDVTHLVMGLKKVREVFGQ